jgi:hypothetical protein
MEEATHAAWLIVSVELSYRSWKSLTEYQTFSLIPTREFSQSVPFGLAYVSCIVAIWLRLKDKKFFQTLYIRNLITFLHAADGIIFIFH